MASKGLEEDEWEALPSDVNSSPEPSLYSMPTASEYSVVLDDDLPQDDGHDYSDDDLNSSFVVVPLNDSRGWPLLCHSAAEALTPRSPKVRFAESKHVARKAQRRTRESWPDYSDNASLCSESWTTDVSSHAYDEAGRTIDHTFQDTRSPSKAFHRRRAEAEKYWGFRAVKRGTLDKPVMIQPGTIWQPKETFVVPMSKRLRWEAAQEPPRPHKWHRKPTWYRNYYSFDSLKVSKHARLHLEAELDEAFDTRPEDIEADVQPEASQEDVHVAHYGALCHAQCSVEQCCAEKVTIKVGGDDLCAPEVQEPKEYWPDASETWAWHVLEQVQGESIMTPEALVYHSKDWCPMISEERRPTNCLGLCYEPAVRAADG